MRHVTILELGDQIAVMVVVNGERLLAIEATLSEALTVLATLVHDAEEREIRRGAIEMIYA